SISPGNADSTRRRWTQGVGPAAFEGVHANAAATASTKGRTLPAIFTSAVFDFARLGSCLPGGTKLSNRPQGRPRIRFRRRARRGRIHGVDVDRMVRVRDLPRQSARADAVVRHV